MVLHNVLTDIMVMLIFAVLIVVLLIAPKEVKRDAFEKFGKVCVAIVLIAMLALIVQWILGG